VLRSFLESQKDEKAHLICVLSDERYQKPLKDAGILPVDEKLYF